MVINKKLLAFILFLSVGINLLFAIIYLATDRHFEKRSEFEKLQGKYPHLSKRVLQEYPVDILINFLSLRTMLRKEVKSYGDQFGFYFEYLPSGTTIGVNEKMEFHAASLFKVPVIMAYFKQRERLKITEDSELEIKAENLDSEYGNLYKYGAGYSMKFSELVKIALEESDNTAAKTIASNVQEADFNEVYSGLDIELTTDNDGAILTAKNYSSILKALYFSSVLERDNSEKILDHLSKSNFNDKLVAGVGPGVNVAHKIGDFIDKDTGDRAYMDCGIVYVPKRPYLLCMVSRGDEDLARLRMKSVSKMIYDYVSTVN